MTGVSAGDAAVLVCARKPDGASVFTEFEVSVVEAAARSEVVTRYDANGDGAFDVSAYRQTLNDFIAKKISEAELMEVVNAYRLP